MTAVVSEARFIELLRREFELSPDLTTPEATLIGVLGFDSFDFFHLALFLEMLLPGIDLPEIVTDDVTVAQVYGHYVLEATTLR